MDDSLDSGDRRLGTRAVRKLTPRRRSSGGASLMVPDDIHAGAYYLLACADARNKNKEGSERNNCRAAARKLQVTSPAATGVGPPSPTACSNGLDDDGDGQSDSGDPGCSGAADTTETNPAVACDDGVDNDGDGLTDWRSSGGDPSCSSLTDTTEGMPGDTDGDGHSPPADCNDSDPNIHPGAIENPFNALDDDCDGMIDEVVSESQAQSVSVGWRAAP
jgi:Putative metal-binding motif